MPPNDPWDPRSEDLGNGLQSVGDLEAALREGRITPQQYMDLSVAGKPAPTGKIAPDVPAAPAPLSGDAGLAQRLLQQAGVNPGALNAAEEELAYGLASAPGQANPYEKPIFMRARQDVFNQMMRERGMNSQVAQAGDRASGQNLAAMVGGGGRGDLLAGQERQTQMQQDVAQGLGQEQAQRGAALAQTAADARQQALQALSQEIQAALRQQALDDKRRITFGGLGSGMSQQRLDAALQVYQMLTGAQSTQVERDTQALNFDVRTGGEALGAGLGTLASVGKKGGK